MDWLSTHYIELGSTRVSYTALLTAAVVVAGGFLLAARVSSRIRGNELGAPRWRATLASIVANLFRLGGLALALQITGVDVSSILAASAVVAVGVGIALQKVAENFVSGIILMAERSIREGDILEFDGRIAKVRHIGIRATIAQTLDAEELIVPNSMLTQSMVKNLTLHEPVYRLKVTVGVSYASDMEHAETVLRATAEAVAWRELDHKPVILLAEFADSAVTFEVSVWTRDVWGMRRGQSELRKAIWRALRDAKITIAFPQLDVHFDRVTDAPRPAASSVTPPR